MVYTFHSDGHGEVVAEAKAPDVESYLGHHYPASDIPAQARRLYVLDWIRIIPDVAYAPVPTVPVVSPLTGRPLDLSLATLRSVSPIHLEYLRNMGVRASMSVSLVRDGALWGLLACHHREPRRLPLVLRSACEVVGRLVSVQASALAEIERARERSAIRDIEAGLVEAMRGHPHGWAGGLAGHGDLLLRMLRATGAAICGNHGLRRIGDAPAEAEIRVLLAWLSQTRGGVFETNALGELHAPARTYAGVASGLLAIQIAEPPSYVLWFRRELLKTVTWGGDPSKPALSEDNRIHPRRSFAAWVEEVRGVSAPWGRVDVDVAEDLRRHVVEIELERACKAEERLRTELEQVTRSVTTVSEAITSFQRPDVPGLLTTLALEAQSLTGAKYAAVGIGTDPERPFEPWISVGSPPEAVRALGRFPSPVGVLGKVACEGQTLRVAGLQSLPRGHPEATSFLGVPLRHGGRRFGILYLVEKQEAAEFSPADERKVQMLAARAAVAVQIAQLYAREAEARAWLTTTIEQIPGGVLLLDRAGQIVALNRAALAFSGDVPRSTEAPANPAIFDLRSPDGSPLPVEDHPIAGALRGEVTLGRELLARAADGRLVPILSNASPVYDERGEIVGAANLLQDVTAMKGLERLREEWGSAVAHELKQPVNSIAMGGHVLHKRLDGRLQEDERLVLERIQASALRLNRMIDDLLHASLIEARRLPLERRPIDSGVADRWLGRELARRRDRSPGRRRDRGRPAPRGRSRSHSPGSRQSAIERRQVWQTRYSHPGGVRRARRDARGPRDEPRGRHSTRGAARPLQPLSARGQDPRRANPGTGARAIHLEGPGRGARRPDLGRERPRRRHVLPLHVAAHACSMKEARLSVRLVWVFARVSRDPLRAREIFLREKIGPAEYFNPETRLGHRLVIELLERHVGAGDVDIGLRAGASLQPGDFAVLEYAARSCATLGDAIRCFVRYVGLLNEALELALVDEGDRVLLRERVTDGVPQPPAANDFVVGAADAFARIYCRHYQPPAEVRFAHAEPGHRAAYASVFRTAVRFGAPDSGIVLTREQLDTPLTSSDPGMHAEYETHADALLARMRESSGVAASVRRALVAELRLGACTMEEMAHKLAMSVSTLRRRLEAEGTTYAAILDAVRFELAQRYLADPTVTTTDVAFLVGFRDASSFSKAFRRWTGGVSAGEFRLRARAGRPA